jgi:hypothetical protein
MPRKPKRETPIERIFREVTGRKMNLIEKRILLHNPKAKVKPFEIQTAPLPIEAGDAGRLEVRK